MPVYAEKRNPSCYIHVYYIMYIIAIGKKTSGTQRSWREHHIQDFGICCRQVCILYYSILYIYIYYLQVISRYIYILFGREARIVTARLVILLANVIIIIIIYVFWCRKRREADVRQLKTHCTRRRHCRSRKKKERKKQICVCVCVSFVWSLTRANCFIGVGEWSG